MGIGKIFRRLFLVSISLISVVLSFNLPTILVVLDHRFLQFTSRGVVPHPCHTPYSKDRLMRFLPVSTSSGNAPSVAETFVPPVAAVPATSFEPNSLPAI